MLVVLREIQNGGENRVEPRSFVGKSKKLNENAYVTATFLWNWIVLIRSEEVLFTVWTKT